MIRIREERIDTPEYYESVWSEETNQRPWYDATRQRELLQHVRPGMDVLEVGAGVFGAIQYALEQPYHGQEFGWLAVQDYSHTARDIVQAKFPQIEWVMDAIDDGLAFPDESFDCVIAGEVIEHVEDPAAFVAELVRVCAPGGHITLSTVDTTCANARKLHPPLGHYPEHLWVFELGDLAGFFEKAGCSRFRAYLFGDYQMVEAMR